jgi:Protoglobin
MSASLGYICRAGTGAVKVFEPGAKYGVNRLQHLLQYLIPSSQRSYSIMEHVTDESLEHLETRISYLKAFLDVTDVDAAILRSAKPFIVPLIPHILDAVYTKLLSFEYVTFFDLKSPLLDALRGGSPLQKCLERTAFPQHFFDTYISHRLGQR